MCVCVCVAGEEGVKEGPVSSSYATPVTCMRPKHQLYLRTWRYA